MKTSNKIDMDLLLFIVNHGEARRVMNFVKEEGILGGTIFLGEGTAGSGLLRTLGLDSVKKEIVMLVSPTLKAEKTLAHVADRKKMEKKNHGIGIRLPLENVAGLKNRTIKDFDQLDEHRNPDAEHCSYQASFVIVDQGEVDDVMEVAEKNGAQGGTIIEGLGAGSKQASKVLNIEIEPEKEILFLITKNDVTTQILDAISDYLNVEKANAGITFTVDLTETRGIYG